MTNKKQSKAIATISGVSSYFQILLIAVLFLACSKKTPEPEPELGDVVAGTYEFTEMRWGATIYVLPFKNDTSSYVATGKIVKIDAKTAKIVINTVSTIRKIVTNDETVSEKLTLKKRADGDIDFLDFLERSFFIYKPQTSTLVFDYGEDDFGNKVYLYGIKK